ncbi:MAG: LpqB family beta-propeller domain-containing protein [bacterium]|nr:LpqB family beta-propeller domain-containing protein [bacterium]
MRRAAPTLRALPRARGVVAHEHPGRTGRAARKLRAAVAGLAALVLAGCTGLPSSGPVRQAAPQIPAGYSVDVLAEGPAEDAEPEQIVEGFLRAAAYGHGDNFSVASQYLAPGVEWDPLAQVRIYAAEKSPVFATDASDGGISVAVDQVAAVDDVGRYRVQEPEEVSAAFTLVRTPEEEWRIAALEDGLLVSDVNFRQTFEMAPLYFLTRDFSATVPELRWYPQENRASHLVAGLLGGPSGWMDLGVTSAFPAGTELGRAGVVLNEGLATINLTDAFLGATDEEVALANAQLEQTLAPLAEIGTIELQVRGSTVNVPDFAVDLTLPQAAPGPVLIARGSVSRYSPGTGLQPISGTPNLTDRAPRNPAVPFEGVDAPRVVIADGGRSLLTVPDDGSEPTVIFSGSELIAPSIDRYGFVWTAQGGRPSEILAVRRDGVVMRIDATWLSGRILTDLRVAADGARAVLVSTEDGVAHVEVVGVGRDALGRPRSLGEPLRIAEHMESVLDVSWVDQTSLVLLGDTLDPADAARVHRITIGGPATVLPLLPGGAAESEPVALTSNRNERSVMVATSSGWLYTRSGASWQLVVTGIADPAYSG